jgi:hypothetical protein
MKSPNHGGRRAGAGRPRKPPVPKPPQRIIEAADDQPPAEADLRQLAARLAGRVLMDLDSRAATATEIGQIAITLKNLAIGCSGLTALPVPKPPAPGKRAAAAERAAKASRSGKYAVPAAPPAPPSLRLVSNTEDHD